MINISIETDLGHDPDDFFALCWLMCHDYINIDNICLVPGLPKQAQLANILCKEFGRTTNLIQSKPNSTKENNLGGFHEEILKKFSGISNEYSNNLSIEEDSSLLIIGPCHAISKYIETHTVKFDKILMQGGFLSYNQYRPTVQIDKFQDKHKVPSFNVGGSPKKLEPILNANCRLRQFVGKNICHTVTMGNITTKNSLFNLAVKTHNRPDKKIHDLVAAVTFLYPEIGTWYNGKPYVEGGEWGTLDMDNNVDYVLADTDRSKLFKLIEAI